MVVNTPHSSQRELSRSLRSLVLLQVASGADDRYTMFWDAFHGTPIGTYRGHELGRERERLQLQFQLAGSATAVLDFWLGRFGSTRTVKVTKV